LLVFGSKEHPDTPPSKFALFQDSNARFIDSVSAALRHRRFLITSGIYLCGLGVMWAFTTIAPVYLQEMGFSDQTTGIYNMGIILTGLFVGTYLSRFTEKIDLVMRLCLVTGAMGFAGYGLLSLYYDGSFPVDGKYYVYVGVVYFAISAGVLTFANLSFISICIVGRPVDEEITMGGMNYIAQALGLGLMKMLERMGMHGLFVLAAIYLTSALLHWLLVETYLENDQTKIKFGGKERKKSELI
jgi:hypothetical protein